MAGFLSPLRKARLERGLSQVDVYLRTGVNQTRLSLAERGLIDLSPRELEALCHEFGLAPEQILEPTSRRIARVENID